MNLTEVMRAMRVDGNAVTANVSEDWLQGRSAFGGLQGAFALCAMRTQVPAELPLRTFQMTFIAPIGAGDCTTRAHVLRAGKNTMHVEAKIQNGDDVLAHAIGVFGAPRTSIVEQSLPSAPTKRDGTILPYVPNLAPSFFQQFDVKLIEGALPFAGAHVTRNIYELGMKEDTTTTEAHLIALADFVPPVGLSWMPKPTPGSSLTWMLEFLDGGFVDEPVRGWLVQTDLVAARDGYTSQSTILWSPTGVPTVLSRQSMVVFG